MKEELALSLYSILLEIADLSSTLVLLVVLLVITIIVLDSLVTYTSVKSKSTGLNANAVRLGIDGLAALPVKTYVSNIQGLAGRPDALIRENGFSIPVERKPLAKKIRDRYVAQLLTYMRLVEEFEGAKPPYGYLILGAKCKRVKIYNTPEKQAWLQNMLDEMQSILKGSAAKAMPEVTKCKTVRNFCSFKAEPDLYRISKTKRKPGKVLSGITA